jgi:hypothetical protein
MMEAIRDHQETDEGSHQRPSRDKAIGDPQETSKRHSEALTMHSKAILGHLR